jgi:hypothetical protein
MGGGDVFYVLLNGRAPFEVTWLLRIIYVMILSNRWQIAVSHQMQSSPESRQTFVKLRSRACMVVKEHRTSVQQF